MQSRHLPRLYALAERDGPGFLRSFRHTLDRERVMDLIHDLLAEKLAEILEAGNPRAVFRTALVRRAISWKRRGDAAVMEDLSDDVMVAEGTSAGSEEERHHFRVMARRALERLPEWKRAIVVAVASGEDRNVIAARFDTSRANVDQIVSRVQRQFKGAES